MMNDEQNESIDKHTKETTKLWYSPVISIIDHNFRLPLLNFEAQLTKN